jgi:hypothetical protein
VVAVAGVVLLGSRVGRAYVVVDNTARNVAIVFGLSAGVALETAAFWATVRSYRFADRGVRPGAGWLALGYTGAAANFVGAVYFFATDFASQNWRALGIPFMLLSAVNLGVALWAHRQPSQAARAPPRASLVPPPRRRCARRSAGGRGFVRGRVLRAPHSTIDSPAACMTYICHAQDHDLSRRGSVESGT